MVETFLEALSVGLLSFTHECSLKWPLKMHCFSRGGRSSSAKLRQQRCRCCTQRLWSTRGSVEKARPSLLNSSIRVSLQLLDVIDKQRIYRQRTVQSGNLVQWFPTQGLGPSEGHKIHGRVRESINGRGKRKKKNKFCCTVWGGFFWEILELFTFPCIERLFKQNHVRSLEI